MNGNKPSEGNMNWSNWHKEAQRALSKASNEDVERVIALVRPLVERERLYGKDTAEGCCAECGRGLIAYGGRCHCDEDQQLEASYEDL